MKKRIQSRFPSSHHHIIPTTIITPHMNKYVVSKMHSSNRNSNTFTLLFFITILSSSVLDTTVAEVVEAATNVRKEYKEGGRGGLYKLAHLDDIDDGHTSSSSTLQIKNTNKKNIINNNPQSNIQNDFENNPIDFLELWPWNHHDNNSTDNDNNNDNNNPSNDDKNNTSDSCYIQSNCTSCVSSSVFCHWCSFDSKCHTKGSIHGCTFGQSCSNPDDDKKKKKDNKCASHTSCTECALSSHLCHWCAFDNQCHVIGSMYGCRSGVDCFNNDRCKRATPEKIDYSKEGDGNGNNVWVEVGVVPILIILFLALSMICCCSICFVGVRVVKGAYDDWTMVHYAPVGSAEVNDDEDYYYDYDSYQQQHQNQHLLCQSQSNGGISIDNDDQNVDGVENDNRSQINGREQGGEGGTRSSNRRKRRRNNHHKHQPTRRQRHGNNANDGSISTLANIEEGEEGVKDNTTTIDEEESEQLIIREQEPESDYDLSRNDNDLSALQQQGRKRPEVFQDSPHDIHNDGDDEESAIQEDVILHDDDNNANALTENLLPSTNNRDDEFHDNGNTRSSSSTTNSLVTAQHSPGRLPRSNNNNNNPLNLTTMTSRFSRRMSQRRSTNSQPSSFNSIKCCYYSCLTFYILSIISTILFVSASIYYFPKVPEFNVCSDEFAWNSIMDSLTSLKVEASFEVLSSVKNTNHLNIILDGVGGSFRHNGEDIGTFSMKTTTIEADSITDVLVTCSVRPDKWEALGLISDYYRNKLEFLINVSGNVKVKGIGYGFPISVKDVLVQVNDKQLDDRHMCHCPEWKDLYPTASPVLPSVVGGGKNSVSFEEAMKIRMIGSSEK